MTPSPSRLLAPAALIAALACAAALATGASAADTVTLLDRPSGLGALPYDAGGRGPVSGPLTTRSLSVDGRYVAFAATADDLLATDDDAAGQHVYRLDRTTGAIVQADVAPGGAQTSYGARSDQPTISADGRYVAFATSGADFGALKGGIYVKDLQTGALELASVDPGGAPVANVQAGTLSGDGRHVAFAVQGASTYLRSLDDGATQQFGAKTVATTAGQLDVAYDGRAVAFASGAQLVAADTDQSPDMYVFRGAAGTVLASRGESGYVSRVSLSDDGEQAAWDADNSRVMAAPVAAGAATEVSKAQGGGLGGGAAPAFERRAGALPAVRLDFVSFQKLVPGDANAYNDVYSAELAHAGDPAYTHRVTDAKSQFGSSSWAAADAGAVAVVAAGSDRIPGSDGRSVQLWEAAPAATKLLSIAPGVTRPADVAGDASLAPAHVISDDGARVALTTTASALGAERSTGFDRTAAGSVVVVRDTATDDTILVSAHPDGSPSYGLSDRATIDAAGQRVAFRSDDGSVVPNGAGGAGGGTEHAYVRDLAAGTTELVDRAAGGAVANARVYEVVLSADGRHVAFTTIATNLPGAPNNGAVHVYVKDLGTGTITLADRNAAGVAGDGSVNSVDLNGDGTRVAFASTATNLGAGDPGVSNQHIYVRDLAAGTTTWVSAPEDRDPTHATTTAPALDRAGDTVAYWARGARFGHGMPAQESSHFFVTEVATGATELVDRDAGGAVLPAAQGFVTLSADGRRAGFGVFDGATAGTRLHVRDLASATTTARDVGQARGVQPSGALAPDGRCTVFTADDLGPLPGSSGPDFAHAYKACDGPITQAPPPLGGPPPGTGQPPVVWPGAPRDRTAPKVTKAKLSQKRFAVGKVRTATTAKAAAKRTARPHETTIAFRLSERATVTIRIVRVKGSKRIVTLTRRKVAAGNVKVNYTGRTKATVLKPGAYRAEVVATDAAGNRSKAVRLAFTVVSR